MSTHASQSFLEEKGKYPGIFSWIFSTDHKRIGILYLVSMLSFFAVGVMLGIMIRLELIAPGQTIMPPQMYNAIFTLHGVIMIFLFVIPGLAAPFGNFFLPILIGAKDVAFPRLNLLSWYLFVGGAAIVILSLFTGGGPPDTGWTFYVPYSLRTGTNVTLAVFGAFVLGFSSILTGVNFVSTIHMLRAPGMKLSQMPLFPWTLYATGWVQILATPILSITLLLIILERVFGIGLFEASKGGDPVLYQHLFWIYSHPAVYIMILPAMGAISEMIATFSQKRVFGYKAMVAATLSIAFVGYLVWGHHMFVSGQSDMAVIIFSLLTFLVAIPSGVKVFNWVATLYKGRISLEPPMLFSLSFIFLFSIGGLTGLVQGALATDIHVHDTTFVVAHFHYVMFGGTGFAFFGALHYWFPKMFGKMYNKKVASVAWAIMFVGFNVLYFPMFIMGMRGMPRRYYDYLPEFQPLHFLSTVGSWILVTGIIILFTNLIVALRRNNRAPANPWNGATLEWKIPSPPPLENFDEEPKITGGPYEFTR